MDAEAEGQVLAGVLAVNDEAVGVFDCLLVPVARDVPHDDFVALLDLLAAKLRVLKRGAAHMRQGCLPTNDFGDHGFDERRVVPQLLVLNRVLVQGQKAAGDRVAGRVVAADDQEKNVSQILHRPHVFRRFALGQHGDEIVARLGCVDALIPQLGEVGGAIAQFIPAGLLGLLVAEGGACGGDIRPAGELPAFFPREIEKGSEHLRRQLDRHAVYPVERLIDRQRIENRAGALADRAFEFRQIAGCDDRAHNLALRVVLRRVHHDEHRQEETFFLIAEGDAAQGGFGRIDAVVGVDMHDVFIFGHRPERAVFALLAVMDRVFMA